METTQTVSARPESVTAHRLRLDYEHRLLDIIEDEMSRREGIDEMSTSVLGMWTYYEPSHVAECGEMYRRERALSWLGRHVKLILAVARHLGGDITKRPTSSPVDFGWIVDVKMPDDEFLRLYATVPSAITCEMVPTGEMEHIPAQDRPVMERRCPKSIFAGIAEEVEV